MSDKYEKLKDLLKELFQLDKPDLDFGIYRIMHARSKEITQFLDNDLLPQIKDSFAVYQSADKVSIQEELDKTLKQAEVLGADPETLPKVKELRNKLSEAVDIEMLERETYDHLYSFFRRYYSEGDFISKRVYKEGVYAIPYEGEEVKLHWANADQYYIKTSEYLRDYAFRLNPSNKSDPKRVHFRLVDVAEGEHGNVKEADDKKRVFILANKNFIFIENNELVIQFEYRQATLSDWPEDQRDAKKNAPNQKDLITFAEQRLLSIGDFPLSSWIGELGKSHIKADGEKADYSKLVAHLNRYTARNTFDYFIHKDLGTFLNRELDFYIKNEVMHLDDIENETAPRVEQYLSKIKVIRLVAKKIIDFLAQLEDFQKKLWLKKKFVVETNYCLTLDRVPEEFYPEIVNNKAQIEEWIKLFAIDEIQAEKGDLIESDKPGFSIPLTVEFLKSNDKLVLDTKFFSDEFKAKLIGGIENFDEQMDGLLIHSENFQALNLLQARYRERVKCVYIDPPYNANSSEILYKNTFKHSSWASLMENRLEKGKCLIHEDHSHIIAIDEVEQEILGQIISCVFPGQAKSCLSVVHNPRGQQGKNISYLHEFAYFTYPNDSKKYISDLKRNEVDSRTLRDSGTESDRTDAATCFYPFIVKNEEIIAIGEVPADAFHPQSGNIVNDDGTMAIWPIDDNGNEKKWRYSVNSVHKILPKLTVKKGRESFQIIFNQDLGVMKSAWVDPKYDASEYGTKVLQSVLGIELASKFSYPKSLNTVIDSIRAGAGEYDSPLILDYFAGSGTTGHAVINLNREDQGKRKFILVEMGDYFDTVLKPRIQKVIYSSDWKNGKPTSRDTGISHCFKYLRLESYEDTLNNLDLQRSKEQENMLNFKEEGADKFKEDYILRYMLDVESRGSASLLNIDAFSDPTAYKMKVKIPGSDESREVKVDLIETFNYLLGLEVKNISAPQIFNAEFERNNEGRLRIKGRISEKTDGKWWFRTVTGTTLNGRKILVIWRNFPKTDDAESIEENNLLLDTWFTKKDYSSKDSEFDTIYVNGTNNLENLKTPEDLWKVRLIEEDFMRLMFEDTGV
jgi:adenine-specific DNA-methyltransferase